MPKNDRERTRKARALMQQRPELNYTRALAEVDAAHAPRERDVDPVLLARIPMRMASSSRNSVGASCPPMRLDSAIDLSDVTLKRVKQIDHGTIDISLTGDQPLKAITGAGSRSAGRDPRMVALSEVISRINSLLAGEFEPGTIEGFVRSAASHIIADEDVAGEIDANEIDQFRKSPTLPVKIVDAVLDVPGVTGKMADVAEDSRLVDLIAQAAYLLRKIQKDEAQTREDEAGGEGDEL